MDERSEQQPPTTSIRILEQVLGAPATRAGSEPSGAPDRTREGVPTDTPAAGLEIAFYPERLERRVPVTLSPSQAVGYADDPDVRAAAASTAGSRQVIGAEGAIDAACSEQLVRDLLEPEEPAALTPAEPDPEPTAPERTRPWWEAAQAQHAAPRRPWWKRLLGLGR